MERIRRLTEITNQAAVLWLIVGSKLPRGGQLDTSYHRGMVFGLKSRASWCLCLVGIIAGGILSRVVHTGMAIIDKYLGDALYAAMVYAILRIFWLAAKSARLAVSAMAIMTAIELFQLTMIPAHLLASEHLMVRICARLMGTEFSFLDLLTYAVGIGCIYLADSSNA